VNLVNVRSPAEWLERAEPLLLADEPRNNLILGLAGTLRDRADIYPDFALWLVEDTAEVVGAALRTRPYNLVLGPANGDAAELIARSVDEELPGVVGCVPEVDRFVAARGRAVRPRFRQGIYALREVVPPRPAAGSPRLAGPADRALLLEWWRDFAVEALGDADPDGERLTRSLDHRLEGAHGGVAVWEDRGRAVSCVGYGSPTPTGIRIGPVYTPPDARGHGYASALTAHVSQEQLDRGRRFCFLYTDLANPTSNKIYVALGYEPVGEAVEYTFV
jgi:GNAT superfamily N-acetyltransferase